MKVEKMVRIIQIAIGINFLWFGMLKMFPGMSPAESLAIMTIEKLTFGLIAPHISIKLLAIWEVLIGTGFIIGMYPKFFVRIFMLHMVLTFSPLFLFPELCFTVVPLGLTIVGQYIIKNLVFIASGALICNTLVKNNVCAPCSRGEL
ncbi:doxx family protein [Sulfuricurvum sp.]|uniref:doxx family protein n=1 Tax=Sulfuricurvum sp. TaxID=2025608 RepID=UPI002E36E3E4|nr:doxx family protein [Sulfuricurvum sp.]HEX5330180.1 doxx family protein [Sulfuricurvum sp.]